MTSVIISKINGINFQSTEGMMLSVKRLISKVVNATFDLKVNCQNDIVLVFGQNNTAAEKAALEAVARQMMAGLR